MKYRPEIDGLRAISVTAVILFHAGFAGFAGGFVGVDVFFVISGFLITQILAGELEAGDFSLARFYERRARRILPALYLVVGVSAGLALYLDLPGELREFSRTVMATLLFVSNLWYWWRGADYFAPSAERDPMLHTWSLGVEEQYYLVFPLLMFALWRFGARSGSGPRRAARVIAALSAISLVLAEIGWRVAPEANFFLLPTRAWQLGFGALAAFAWVNRAAWPAVARGRGLAEAAAAAGALLVLGSVFLMDASVPFPSLAAVPPTGGAALVLLFATPGTVTGRLLALRPMVLVGLVSYGAYLWHQPLLAFARIAAPEMLGTETLGTGALFGIIGLTFALAAATLFLVERPFRRRGFLTRARIFAAGGAGGLVLFALAGLGYRTSGFRDFYPEYLRATISLTSAEQGAYVRGAYDAHGPGGFAVGGGPRLLVIGDSYSQDLYNMIRETGAFPGWQIALRYVLARCQIYLGPEDVAPLLAPDDRRLCAGQPSAADFVVIAREADVVIFAASWRDWSAARLPVTLAAFGFRPDQRALVLGRKRFAKVTRPMITGKDAAGLAALRANPGPEHLAIVARMRETLPAGQLIDSQRLICGGVDCPLFTPEGALISIDGAHLTREGAKYVGTLLFADPLLAPYAAGGNGAGDDGGDDTGPGGGARIRMGGYPRAGSGG